MSEERRNHAAGMRIRRAVDPDRWVLAELAARLQRRPERHIAYLATDADTIAAEMIEDGDDWTAASVVAERDGGIVGWLMGSVDHELGRVWWFGPFADGDADRWTTVVEALYFEASALLAPAVTEEEMAVDVEYARLIGWATRRGFSVEEGSFALHLGQPLDPPTIPIRPATGDDITAVARLHDAMFAGTHTPGRRLVGGVEEGRLCSVAECDGEVVGYVAVERQPDGSGYIDYVGVAARHRRQGTGAQLIRAGVTELRAIGCDSVHLTVRQHSEPARALYAALGFREERLIIPLRKGFSLA